MAIFRLSRSLAQKHLASLWPYRRARVSGNSMEPTFKDGDVLLVRIFKQTPVDIPLLTVVLIEREVQPGIFYIKRIQKSHGDAYWVEGDNRDPDIQERMSDSKSWGYIQSHEIRGKVIFRSRKKAKS